MQKDTIVKISSIKQRQKYPKEYAQDSKTILHQLETAKPTFLNRKPSKKQKRRKILFRSFLMKVSVMLLSAGNPEESFMFAKRFVPSKNSGEP